MIDALSNKLNEDFENICDWFIHFGDDRAKSILFARDQRAKNIRKLKN